jgi:acetyl esterase
MTRLEVEIVGTSRGRTDPELAAILELVRSEDREPVAFSAAGLRARNALARFGLPVNAGVEIETLSAHEALGPPVALRLYRPRGALEALPVTCFVHGGCFVFCRPEWYDGWCSYLALRARCAVVSIDYRLAPEHPFPAAVDDVQAALWWLRAQGPHLGVDARRLALAGDSAGGNLAAVTSLVLRERAQPPACLQVLFYPITNLAELDTPSYQQYGDGFLSTELMRWSREQYVPSALRREPWVSPLLATDLSELPKTLLVTAELDVLRDEGEAFAERLLAAGNPVRAVRYANMEHAFVSMAGALPAGRHALDLAARELQGAFEQAPLTR